MKFVRRSHPAALPLYTRRAMLAGTGGALVLVLAGCGGSEPAATTGDDESSPTDVSNSETSAAAASEASPSDSVAATTDSVAAPEATAATEATAAADPTEPAAAGSSALGDGNALAISFAYVAADNGRRIHNPYVAVWVESADGALVRTVALSYQQGRKGKKWLRDLKQWFRADVARQDAGGADLVDTISSPTRLPGDYSLLWDGTDDGGAPVAPGTYTLFVEAAREKGPYQVASAALTLDGAPISITIEDADELQGIVVKSVTA